MDETATSTRVIKVNEPRRSEILVMRALICCGAVSIIAFLYWFLRAEHVGNTYLFWLLTFALVFKIVKMAQEWYYYWSPSVTARPLCKKQYSVDVFTTYCPGEPKSMIIRTLQAMQAIRYPHTSYLCDEANDPDLKRICAELGVKHITRAVKKDAKAGNINNALSQATGELCLVLDPDHEPFPEFLDRVVPYFENEEIGFVQCVQAYGNQEESFVALGAAQQTYHFYGPMMMTMNSYGTAQAIGANCTFRRKALDSIGGHAAGLAEDMHTAMQLHAKGWKSVYVPEILSRGLVPATLSSYYKQQLKWSRGVFELLFRVYPKLYKKFTWRQKLHYFALPHYFLYGLVNLVDIAIPLLALVLAQVPWELDMVKFGIYFLPLCALSLTIRTYAQRWLLEKHERGLHFAGGMMRMATWWIFLLGFIYSILNIRVPYIPTPKEDEHHNCPALCAPNIIVILLSLAGITYGLSIDLTPFSIAMAFYSLMVAGMLAFTVMSSQQKFMQQVGALLGQVRAAMAVRSIALRLIENTEQVAYRFLHNGAIVLIIAVSAMFLSYSTLENEVEPATGNDKELGGFYLGISEKEAAIMHHVRTGLGASVNLVSLSVSWLDTVSSVTNTAFRQVSKKNCIPFIKWNLAGIDPATLYKNTVAKEYDSYLTHCADAFRKHRGPIFISFPCAGDDPDQFIKAWQYVCTFFNQLGVSNLTWVWEPPSPQSDAYYPGEKFVDWIGLGVLNYGSDESDSDWYTFAQLYKPYRNRLGKYQKPVLLSAVGCQRGDLQAGWFSEAFHSIIKEFQEVRGLVLYTAKERMILSNGRQYEANFTPTAASVLACRQALAADQLPTETYRSVSVTQVRNYKSPFVRGTPGKFELLVNKKPYYIRGVAYNTAHDWRDGFMPLTRRQLEHDFTMISEMGANTIRRYDESIYDRNILMIAAETGLHVQYGFWFDPQHDFYRDTAMVTDYMQKVQERVEELKHDTTIIAWSLGNETWGLLKHNYAKPYLTLVRQAYIHMIEQLAERIHQIDPTRPVFTSIEHQEHQIAGELVAFHDDAPSVDVIGVNSYYREQISQLNHLAWQVDSLRPYLVSEFGPRGYWDPGYNKTDGGALLEESDAEKAAWYRDQWNYYIQPHKGYNIGGFAYCWHDRMEGSCTWFGLTDFRGRPKPAYFALKETWTGRKAATCYQASILANRAPAPGASCVFSAKVAGEPGMLHYEWYLHKGDFLQRVDNVEYLDDGRSALVKVPKEASNYRLYLYVSDKAGCVTTASFPICVRNESIP